MTTEGSITTTATTMTTPATTKSRTQARSSAPIYLSYSNQTGFIERYFVVQLYKQLVTHGLGEGVIWFDHEQGIHPDKTVTWLADRLEAIDLSLGSILILSEACQQQRFMNVEARAIVDRKISSETSNAYGLFVIFLHECPDFSYIRTHADFSYTFGRSEVNLTIEERVAVVINQLIAKLLPFKKFQFIKYPNDSKTSINEKEKLKPICTWSSKDIQAFLSRCGIHEGSRELFAEKNIDGYLLLSCTENELKDCFGLNNRKIRQALIDNVIQIIHQERQTLGQWHHGAKKIRAKSDCIYIIYDPEDFSIAGQISLFLQEKRFRVFSHNLRYGKTKNEFLELNGPNLAKTKDVIYVLTEKSSRSTFTFHELTLAEWLEKPIVTVYIDNVWANMRSSVRALLADYPSVDFVNQVFSESLTILHTYLRPQVLSVEETPDFVQKLKQIVRPLASVAASNRNSTQKMFTNPDGNGEIDLRSVYLSYSKNSEKWSVIHSIERLVFFLENHGYRTGIQIKKQETIRDNDSHFLPKIQTRSSLMKPAESFVNGFNSSVTTSSVDVRHAVTSNDMRQSNIVVLCLTPKYFRNDNCLNELRLCEIYQKQTIVCLVRHMDSYRSHQQLLNTSMNLEEQIMNFVSSRLPMTTMNYLRKSIRQCCIDLSTDELFSRNASILFQRLETLSGSSSNAIGSTSHSTHRSGFVQASEVF